MDARFRACLARRGARFLSLIAIGSLGAAMLFGEDRPRNLPAREWLLMACFPVAHVAGLILAWKREVAGALLGTAAIAAFYSIHLALGEGMPGGFFLVFLLPCILFLTSHVAWRRLRARAA